MSQIDGISSVTCVTDVLLLFTSKLARKQKQEFHISHFKNSLAPQAVRYDRNPIEVHMLQSKNLLFETIDQACQYSDNTLDLHLEADCFIFLAGVLNNFLSPLRQLPE